MSRSDGPRAAGGAGVGAHPTPNDLANLAREQLGRKKTQRILEHCKQCPECAELLLEAVSNQPFERERLRLSTWNWISIGVLLAALIGVFALLVWLLGGAARESGDLPAAPEFPAEELYSEQPDSWSESLFTRFIVAPGGDTMLRFDAHGVSLLDLAEGADMRARLWLDFDGVMAATFDGNGALARYANKRHDLGWFIVEGEGLWSTPLPPESMPVWSAGNGDVAWTRPPATRIYVGYPPRQRSYEAGGRVLGMVWAPAGEELYALVMDEQGSSTLVRARRATTRLEVVRAGLDASPLRNLLAVSPDGRTLFVALASAAAPDAESRHAPAGDRDLDIYAIDTRDGDLRRVIGSAGDDFWPGVQRDALYWTHNRLEASVVLIRRPDDADPPSLRVLAGHEVDGVDAQLPRWDPRGGQIAYTRGPWRLADWGLPFDVMKVTIGPDGGAAGTAEPLIVGYHQDLTPRWSSDGRWLAYRSRRSATPVPYYAGPGVADGVFLRAADDPGATEQPVSREGWEVGNPSWGPDGRLVFDSWDRGGVPGFSRPWIARIDPRNGEVLSRERLPLPDEVSGSVSAVWSPVAEELLLVERRDPESQTLWLMSLGDGRAERLIDFTSSTLGGADWTPDGAAVVYAASVDGRMQLYEISRAGGEPVRITHEEANLMHPSVSPDGRWIAATKLVQRKEVRRVPLAVLR